MAWAFERSVEELYEQLAENCPPIAYYLEREDRRQCTHWKSSKLTVSPPAIPRTAEIDHGDSQPAVIPIETLTYR